MQEKIKEILDGLVLRYPALEAVKGEIRKAYEILEACYAGGGKLLIAGNGGSAADSEHIVGELMKGFVKRRPVGEEHVDGGGARDRQPVELARGQLRQRGVERRLIRRRGEVDQWCDDRHGAQSPQARGDAVAPRPATGHEDAPAVQRSVLLDFGSGHEDCSRDTRPAAP